MTNDISASLYLSLFPRPSASIFNSEAGFGNIICHHAFFSAFCLAVSCHRYIARVSIACSIVCCPQSACRSVNSGTCSPVIHPMWGIKGKQKVRPTVLLFQRTALAAAGTAWGSGAKTVRSEHEVKCGKAAKACGGQSRSG